MPNEAVEAEEVHMGTGACSCGGDREEVVQTTGMQLLQHVLLSRIGIRGLHLTRIFPLHYANEHVHAALR